MDDKCYSRFFLDADSATYHRQYEALRAIFVDGLPQNDVAARFGYTTGSMRQLVLGFRRAMRSNSPPPFFNSRRSADRRRAVPTAYLVRQQRPSPMSERARFWKRKHRLTLVLRVSSYSGRSWHNWDSINSSNKRAILGLTWSRQRRRC